MKPTMNVIVWTFFIHLLIVQNINASAKRWRTKPEMQFIRLGDCPHPYYVFGGANCSIVGSNNECPLNHKCCPSTTGPLCALLCPISMLSCTINCQFGYEVDSSGCSICDCADNPCLSITHCPRGTTCISVPYTPCVVPNTCGFTGQCIPLSLRDSSTTPKPNRCPSYWPYFWTKIPEFATCNGSDDDCPDSQKCCEVPVGGTYMTEPNYYGHYCNVPCPDLSSCTLTCSLGRQVINFCEICACIVDECLTTTCSSGKLCHMLPAPCFRYSGSPPCPLIPTCV